MNEVFEDDSGWPWYWKLLILLLLGGFLCAIAIPNFISNGRTNVSDIINNLQQIDAAKNYWAFERGFTNESQVLQLTNQLAEKDLFPYIHRTTDKSNDLFASIEGEIYVINPLNRGPEAKLNHKEKFGNKILPKETIVRLETNSANGFPYQIIFPDGTKMGY